MHTTNYIDTFIEVAPDWQGLSAKVPEKEGTIAKMQYDILVENPYKYTSDDVIFGVFAERNGIPNSPLEREKFFSKGQACMRCSPLTKTHGWGVYADHEGKMAIYPFESSEYKKLANNPSFQHVKAMRTKK